MTDLRHVVEAIPDLRAGQLGRWFVASSNADGKFYAVTLGADGTQACSCLAGRMIAMRVELGHEPGKSCRHLAAVEARLRSAVA